MQNDPSKQGGKEKEEEPVDNNWVDDQKERGYYYDDAHGYQQFDPESDEEMDEDGESISKDRAEQ